MEVRRAYHNCKPNAWLRCNDKSGLEFKFMEDGIANKETAIALESLYAARGIAAEPGIARGGAMVPSEVVA